MYLVVEVYRVFLILTGRGQISLVSQKPPHSIQPAPKGDDLNARHGKECRHRVVESIIEEILNNVAPVGTASASGGQSVAVGTSRIMKLAYTQMPFTVLFYGHFNSSDF